jgi:hydroxysqualene synthase
MTTGSPLAESRWLRQAYQTCERIAREHDENFPVASRLLPPAMRPHVAAVYAFARTADDFADEGNLPAAERQRLLDDWSARLHACAAPIDPPADRAAAPPPGDSDLVFRALGATIRARGLPLALFDALLSAFRHDITTHRYATWTDLLGYCERSANPVGRLVLRIAGYDDPALDRASDALCTALQLTNLWQDLERDWSRGRLYVPAEERDACGASESDLGARPMSAAWRSALARVAARTRDCFAAGRPVCDGVRGRLRFELRLTWLGGVRILDRIERAGFDVCSSRPSLGAADVPTLVWGALAWRADRQR